MFNKNWKPEYSITLLVLLGAILYFVPVSFESTRQASFISRWNEMYNKVDYMFQVINAHISDEKLKSFDDAKNAQERERLMIELVKPYLRIDLSKNPPKRYKTRYMKRTKVYKGENYHFTDLFLTKDNKLVGIKDLYDAGEDTPAFMMMFDINGILPPNTWGKDVYGINIYQTGKIEPFGQGLSMDDLRQDCSPAGTGVSCSYFYKIGGGFEE